MSEHRYPGIVSPAVFISHGSPMVAIETGPFQDSLKRLGRDHWPNAVVVVSAHWDTGTEIRVGSASNHQLIYDFGGFPEALFQLEYDAKGDPALARDIDAALREGGFPSELDDSRGLDHGAWIPLRLMYPSASVPVVQVSLPSHRAPEALFRIGNALAPLLSQGIMILGSGGIVHNLDSLDWNHRDRRAEHWAEEFDGWFRERLATDNFVDLLHYTDQAPHAALAVPTKEHFAPFFVVAGAATPGSRVEWIYQGFQYGTLSMRSFKFA